MESPRTVKRRLWTILGAAVVMVVLDVALLLYGHEILSAEKLLLLHDTVLVWIVVDALFALRGLKKTKEATDTE